MSIDEFPQSLPSSVAELKTDLCSLSMYPGDELPESRDIRVIMNAEHSLIHLSFRVDSSIFYNDQPYSPSCPLLIV